MSLHFLAAFKRMLVTGGILVASAVPHAVQDLTNLKTIIDCTAATIDAASGNSSWGYFSPIRPEGSLGTADLIANISTTVLRAKYLLDVDKGAWIAHPDSTITPTPAHPISTGTSTAAPTGPAVTASPIPAPAPPPCVSLDGPYTEYVSSIPTLSNALVHLGRSRHKELNSPVHEAIATLQQAITLFSTSLLEADLVSSHSILRTIRASSSLESAQVAWSRALNLPGVGGATKREAVPGNAQRFPLPKGQFYSHKDLWGRGRDGYSGVVPRGRGARSNVPGERNGYSRIPRGRNGYSVVPRGRNGYREGAPRGRDGYSDAGKKLAWRFVA